MGADSKMAPQATSACRMQLNSMCYARGRKHKMSSHSVNAPCAIHGVTTAPRKDGEEGGGMTRGFAIGVH